MKRSTEMSSLEIVDFELIDQQPTYEFCKKIFAELGWIPHISDGLENFSQFFNLPKGVFILSKIEKKIIGCAGIISVNNILGLIKRFYIDSEYRGKGVAQKQFKVLLDRAKGKGLKTLVLETEKYNKRAHKFYIKSGFQQFDPHANYYEVWEETRKPNLYYFLKLEIQ